MQKKLQKKTTKGKFTKNLQKKILPNEIKEMNQYPNKFFFLSENKCCYIVVPVKSGIRKHQSNEQEFLLTPIF